MVKSNELSYTICILVLGILWARTGADVFSAVSHLTHMLDTHQSVRDNLNYYIQVEEERLKFLEMYSIRFKNERPRTMNSITTFLENPINCFVFIKRLSVDLISIEKRINETTEFKLKAGVERPSRTDLEGASRGMLRLQRTYLLNVSDLASGILYIRQGKQEPLEIRTTPMKMADCYELARALYKKPNIYHAVVWMQQAYHKYKTEHEPHRAVEVHLLEQLIFAYDQLNDYKHSSQWAEKLRELDPENSYFERSREDSRLFKIKKVQKIKRDAKQKLKPKLLEDKQTKPKKVSIRAVCRGDVDISRNIRKRLRCGYLTGQHGALLARFKLEQLHLEPDVLLLHDVMSDREIQHVKDIATPSLRSILVKDEDTGRLVQSNYMISKKTWLKDSDSEVVARLTRRVSAFTGLSMATSDPFHVMNYGIGGSFLSHHDSYEVSGNSHYITPYRPTGDSIATVLLYMSDVQGGATVFPRLKLLVRPKKGAALFWLNLHPTGKPDPTLLHAACPVLLGSKWVLTKWIYEVGQELLKPCNLTYPDRVMKSPRVPKSDNQRKQHYQEIRDLNLAI